MKTWSFDLFRNTHIFLHKDDTAIVLKASGAIEAFLGMSRLKDDEKIAENAVVMAAIAVALQKGSPLIQQIVDEFQKRIDALEKEEKEGGLK